MIMKKHKKLIVMNWKCNPVTIREARALISVSDISDAVICPPAIFLKSVADTIKNATLGAQNGFFEEGAYTGEYSFNQLKNIGVKYAIIGHSERRYIFGETSALIAKKVGASLSVGISPIVCVGEKKRSSLGNAIKNAITELNNSLSDVSQDKAKKIILAYEPIWAIGTGRNATLDDILPVMSAMRKQFNELFGIMPKILYGGSVNAENISEYINNPLIDGALIGSASANILKARALVKKLL